MKYIMVKWKHDDPRDPVLIYSEIDDEQWEHRKVEMFADSRVGFADQNQEEGGSRLGIEPWPDLAKLGAEPEFEISEIAGAEFEAIWQEATRRQ